MKKSRRKDKINLILGSRDYRRLELYLYLMSVAVIVIVYLMVILIFSSTTSIVITAPLSLFIGIFLIFKKDMLIKKISDMIQESKRQKVKKENKDGFEQTMRRITPKKKMNIINVKTPFKDRVKNLRKKFGKKGKEVDYIEIE